MTNHIPKNQAYNVSPGTIVAGKWHKNQYKIEKQLGFGAQGTVYLAKVNDKKVALKIGKDSSSITSEVNVLRHFSKVQGEILGPSLYDVDDWVTNVGTLPFYTMEYLEGMSLLEATKAHGVDWSMIYILQLLKDLGRLHNAGWAFGDLKPENLIITTTPRRIRWLDVGGTTKIGRSIKEYTEFFDRGYWGCGTRVAEPSYDLFAVAMTFINIAYQNRFEKGPQPKEQLLNLVKNQMALKPYQDILTQAILGKYQTAEAMRQEFLIKLNETSGPNVRNTVQKQFTSKQALKKTKAVNKVAQASQSKGSQMKKPRSASANGNHSASQMAQGHRANKRSNRRKQRNKEWRQTLYLALGIMIAYVIYVTIYVM